MADNSKTTVDAELDWTGEEHLNPREFQITNLDEYRVVNYVRLRKEATDEVLKLFKKSNIFILFFVSVLVIVDVYHTVYLGKDHSFRIINENVLMALIGGTTVQLGTIVLVIFRSLFPVSSKSKTESQDNP